jgi:ferredoxin-NADP reductase
MILPLSAPRNNFVLNESAPHSVLVAGGIGVAPLLCMLRRLVALNLRADFVYCARSRKEAAFIDEMTALAGAADIRLSWHFDDEQGGPPNLKELLSGRPADTHLDCCGPRPMRDAFERV